MQRHVFDADRLVSMEGQVPKASPAKSLDVSEHCKN